MLEPWLPHVDQPLSCSRVCRIQEAHTLLSRFAGLRHQRFTKRVMAGNEELVTYIEPFEKSFIGQPAGLKKMS